MTNNKHHLILIALYALSFPVMLSSFERITFVFQTHANLEWVDARYASHPWITVAHLLPGLVFCFIGPLQFHRGIRRYRLLHRLLGKTFIATGILSSVGVMWMVIAFPAVGGLLTQVVTFAIVLTMIALMGHAWHAARNRRIIDHQCAMVRAFALGLTVSTARIFIQFADHILNVPFEQSFTICSAIALVVNLAVAELLIVPRLRSARPISNL